MLSVSSSSLLQSHANVKAFSERLDSNRLKESQNTSKDNSPVADSEKTKPNSNEELLKQLQSLKNRDREVRAHELAHASVGGQYASGAHFTYQKGSDGVLYAVAGEVSISTSAVPDDPRATLEKAQIIQRAALAPANPSAQDRSVAASASALAQKARVEITQLLEVASYSDEPKNKDQSLDEIA